jgi:hypothetical protein
LNRIEIKNKKDVLIRNKHSANGKVMEYIKTSQTPPANSFGWIDSLVLACYFTLVFLFGIWVYFDFLASVLKIEKKNKQI